MFTNILFLVFIAIVAIGTYYQIKTYKKTRELHSLQMKNELKRSELIDVQIKKTKAEQHFFELGIQDMKKENDV